MAKPEVTLRPATIDDKVFLFDLARTVYKQLVIDQFGTWDEPLQKSNFERKWERANYRIIGINDKRIGTIWTTEEKDHIRLNEIQLLPEFQRQGIGSDLVSNELEKAKKCSKALRLRLLKENSAIYFYERLGFAVYDETESHFFMTIKNGQ